MRFTKNTYDFISRISICDPEIEDYYLEMLERYFETGEEPDFNEPELKRIWFWLKTLNIIELLKSVQYGTREYRKARKLCRETFWKFSKAYYPNTMGRHA